jgi:hypothetical protein
MVEVGVDRWTSWKRGCWQSGFLWVVFMAHWITVSASTGAVLSWKIVKTRLAFSRSVAGNDAVIALTVLLIIFYLHLPLALFCPLSLSTQNSPV